MRLRLGPGLRLGLGQVNAEGPQAARPTKKCKLLTNMCPCLCTPEEPTNHHTRASSLVQPTPSPAQPCSFSFRAEE
jgi:hypothetical protein